MRVSVIQLDIVKGNREANKKAVTEKVDALMREHGAPQVIVLPELWSTGYALDRAVDFASPGGEDEAVFLGELARKHHVAFAGGSVLSSCDGKIYNRAQVIDAQGHYVAGYDKIHLFRLMEEEVYLAQGEAPLWFDLHGFCCASVICYDIRFCELIRKLAVEGAEVLFVSAEWPLPRKDHWVTLLKARAIENQMFVIACNRCGSADDTVFGGNSMIIAPDGSVLAQADEEEDILSAELDRALVQGTREKIQVFKDRVPYLY